MENDLISRAAAIDAIVSVTAYLDAEYIKNLCHNPANSEDWLGGVCDAINAIEDVNAVDAVPIRHGYWIDRDGQYECSWCHNISCCKGKYCPDCGAKQDVDGTRMNKGDTISRSALLAAYDAAHKGPSGNARKLIEEAPAIDVVPVVHGEWIDDADPGEIVGEHWMCSNCEMVFGMPEDTMRIHRYCPYCGAKMNAPTCGPDYCEIRGGDDE